MVSSMDNLHPSKLLLLELAWVENNDISFQNSNKIPCTAFHLISKEKNTSASLALGLYNASDFDWFNMGL